MRPGKFIAALWLIGVAPLLVALRSETPQASEHKSSTERTGYFGAARFCWRRGVPRVPRGDRRHLRSYFAPADFGTSQQKLHRRQLRARRQRAYDEQSGSALPHGCSRKWFLRNRSVLATSGPENAKRTHRHRYGLRQKGANVFVLEGRSTVSIAGFVLGGTERVGEQPGIFRWDRGFQPANCAALPGMPRYLLCVGARR